MLRWTASAAMILLMSCQRAPTPPDLVLVTWDTVRADKVGPAAAAPGEGSPTPGFDRMATQGVRFEQARTPSPLTLPAHASILTGQLPARHGARLNGYYSVDSSAPMLPELLRERGYLSAAFVSASVLRERYGLARGFDHYADHLGATKASDESPYRDGEATLAEASAWLAEQDPDRPLFLWLHLFDAHRPWQPPQAFADRHQDPYLAEIARVDALTHQLIGQLEERGRLEDAVVVITSDHGEGLGEHGEDEHGWFVYDSTVRVPLLFWSSTERGWTPGGVVQQPVSLTDIAPTLAELAGAPHAPLGRSLLPALRGAGVPEEPQQLEALAAAHHFGAAPVFGVISEGELWVDLPRRERFDLHGDPQQRTNLYDERDKARADALFAGSPRAWPPPSAAAALDEATQRQLAALGYMAAETSDLGADSQLDPKDLTELFDLEMEVFLALHSIPPTERVPLLQLLYGEGLQLDPFRRLGALERALEKHPGLAPLLRAQAEILDGLGWSRSALAALETIPEPDDALRAEIEARRAAQADAERLLRSIQAHIQTHPDDLDALYDLGVTAQLLERADLPEQALTRVLEARPEDDEARLRLAALRWSKGEPEQALGLLDGREPATAPGSWACTAGRILGWSLDRPTEAARWLRRCSEAGAELTPADREVLEAAEG
jgi:choline-sulfatase